MALDKHRLVLYWLAAYLRLTSRALYIACMHVLRSSYLPTYIQNVHPPYTSDPFPYSSPYAPDSSNAGPGPSTPGAFQGAVITATQRETDVLDRYLLLKVREDVRLDETELHLDLDHFRDLFDLSQVRHRVID